jgi:hypothetical protein
LYAMGEVLLVLIESLFTQRQPFESCPSESDLIFSERISTS